MNSTEKKEKFSFFKGVKSEFKKVSWPGKKEILKSSIVVVIVATVVGLIIAVLDMAIQYGVNFLTSI